MRLSRTFAVRSVVCGAFAACTLAVSAAPALAEAPTVVRGPEVRAGETSYATCPANTHLISGGYAWRPVYTNGGSPSDTVDSNAPAAYKSNSWAAKAHKGYISAYALCEKN